jgi:L-2-hydroxyglutarate oxidase LhgO
LTDDCGISIKKLIYPVPNLDYPFLGIHSVTTIDGSVLFGPSSIPAFGRENYSMIKGINPIDLFSIGYHLYGKYISDGEFRKFTHEEMSKFTKNQFVSSAKSIVPKLHSKCLYKSKKVGIRAQLYNTVNKKLEMDFIIERVGNTVHVLNAISPAFTSAFSMAKIIVGNDHAY